MIFSNVDGSWRFSVSSIERSNRDSLSHGSLSWPAVGDIDINAS
jgi:hypothetical protein